MTLSFFEDFPYTHCFPQKPSQFHNFRYFCPREGWGYPSNGESEVEIHCQHDGTWSNDANIETCMSN